MGAVKLKDNSKTWQNINSINLNHISQQHLLILDEVIIHNLSTNVPFIDSIVHYIIEAGGKRLRPIILIYMAYAMMPYDNKQKMVINNALINESKDTQQKNIYILAAIIEFIHTATLLHDDVVDESALRRNKPTVNEVFGNAPAVLVGDFLYSRSFEMMVKLNSLDIMQVLAKTTNVIAEGEVLQLVNIGNLSINIQTYLNVIHYKTAKLFEAACEIAIILQNNQPEIRKQAASYGRHLGCAFQLIDDWLDYAGTPETMGKDIGDDLRQGKITMPLIYLLEYGNQIQKTQITCVINKIKDNTVNNQELETIINLVKESKALEYTKNQAIIESNKAKQALSFLHQDNIYKQILLSICDLAIERLA